MPELTPEIVDDVVAACKEGAEEAAQAWGRALDVEISVCIGEPGTLEVDNLPDELSGPGLAVVLTIGGSGAMVALPESSGLVPDWCAAPDPTGQRKLTTLAQELGMLVLPERFMPDDFKTARVENLAEALRRGGLCPGAGVVSLGLAAEGKQGTARLIWPIPEPAGVLEAPEPEPASQAESKAESKAEPQANPEPKPAPVRKPAAAEKPARAAKKRPNTRFRDLPNFSRSLLRIQVPVAVTLAEKRQPVGRIVELGPGSIIQFDKSCEEMLDMSVGGHPVATGEAVKVGDKFGLRITSVILPEERFHAVSPG